MQEIQISMQEDRGRHLLACGKTGKDSNGDQINEHILLYPHSDNLAIIIFHLNTAVGNWLSRVGNLKLIFYCSK